MRPSITRDDVARRAGVSTAVVSYVLNDGPRPVAARTRAQVLSAIAELGYRPNVVARALRSRHSAALGLVVSDISNPFIGELARAVESTAFEQGYTVLLGNAMVDAQRQMRYLRHFVDRRVDGLLVVPVAPIDPETVEELNSGSIATVVLDRPAPRTRGNPPLRAATVLADNVGGGWMVTQHLIEHGHRRLGCLAGPPPMAPSAGRLKGFSAAVRRAGLSPASCRVVRSSVNRRAGYEASMELLAGRRRPTAVFAVSDEQAIGLLRAASELGLMVPDDVAVASFDGIRPGVFCTPALTTARQAIGEMATVAVTSLVSQIAGGPTPQQTTTLPVELVRRGSCGCPDPPASAAWS